MLFGIEAAGRPLAGFLLKCVTTPQRKEPPRNESPQRLLECVNNIS